MVDKEKISAIISRNARLAPSLPAMPERLLAYITTRRFPSWNDILKVDRRAAVAIKQKARETGRQAAAAWAKGEGLTLHQRYIMPPDAKRGYLVERLDQPLTLSPVFVFIRIWRKASLKDPKAGDRIRDVFNESVKAFLDGFTDAGIWLDDNEQCAPDFWIRYAGTKPEHLAEVFIYESTQ
jgi:hypothetical protein